MEGSPVFKVSLNSNEYSDLQGLLDSNTSGRFESIMNVDRVDVLKVGSGVIVDVVYQLKTLEYAVETEDPDVASQKSAWETAVKNYKDAESNGALPITLKGLKDEEEAAYNNYIKYLEESLNEV
jgi:hypothetical protein